MNTKTPAIIFLVLGIIFIVFNKLILGGIRWLDKTTWNEARRKQFPGHGGKSSEYKPWMVVVLGFRGLLVLFSFGSPQSDERPVP